MIEKKYKRCRCFQYLLLAVALICCFLPFVILYFKTNGEGKAAAGGVLAAVTLASGAILWRKILKKSPFPYTVSLFLTMAIAAFFIFLLKKTVDDELESLVIGSTGSIIGAIVDAISILLYNVKKTADDALTVITVGAGGGLIGAIFEAISIVCRLRADEIKRYYKDESNKTEVTNDV